MNNQIVKKVFFSSHIERVWEAITDPKEISQWFMPAAFKAKKGYEYNLKHEGMVCRGKVLEVEKPTRLVYTWINPGTVEETVVTWLLEKKEDGTELTLIHQGYEKYKDAMREKLFGENTYGWDLALQGLSSYLATKHAFDR